MHARLHKSLLRLLFLPLFLLVFGQCSAFMVMPTIPNNAGEFLRHEKHGILAFGCMVGGRCGSFLITRNKTFHRNGLEPSGLAKIQAFRDAFQQPLGRSSMDTEALYDLAHEVYVLLVAPFKAEIDDLYQLTIYPGEGELQGLPFEALVLDDQGPYAQRKFLTEVWAVSYLFHFNLLPVDQREEAVPVEVDASGEYHKSHSHPGSGSFLSNKYGRSDWLPEQMKRGFWQNVKGGNYVDEALGLARTAYFDSLRSLSNDSALPPLLDPRRWAAASVVGDIAPTHQRKGFPWWILVPIGLILVVLFGRKL